MALKGQDALRRKLLKMTPEIDAQLQAAVLAGAEDVAKTAKSLVPKRTGKLMNSIGAVLGNAPSTTATQALRGGGSKVDGIRATAYAGDDNAYYAGWIEFGTAPHKQGGLFKGTLHPGTVAQPFFFPAYRANKRRARSRITRAITKSVKKVAQS